MVEIIVPDASVILKWVLQSTDEDDQEKALQIRSLAMEGKVILKVPSLWFYEVGNILSRNFPKQAKELLEALTAFGLEEAIWSKEWLNKCLFIIQHHKVTFYDAAYHSLALVEKGTFVTADRRYIKKTHAVGSVRSIDNWT
jgi:predicted nucleic acid-binding protein